MRIINVNGNEFKYQCDVCGHIEPKKTGVVHYLSKADGCVFKVYECRECGILQRERRNPYEPTLNN